MVAAPNISQNGNPIQFQVKSGEEAKVQLAVYDISGELVYQTEAEVQMGLNILVWEVWDKGHEPVASGLYIYRLTANYGNGETAVSMGKVIVIH